MTAKATNPIKTPVEPSTEDKTPDFTWARDAGFRSVYSNQTQFSSTAFDFAMTFGEIADVAQDTSSVKVEQRVRVVMSPLHFKLFVVVALQNLKGYEDKFGEIKAPEGATLTTPPAQTGS